MHRNHTRRPLFGHYKLVSARNLAFTSALIASGVSASFNVRYGYSWGSALDIGTGVSVAALFAASEVFKWQLSFKMTEFGRFAPVTWTLFAGCVVLSLTAALGSMATARSDSVSVRSEGASVYRGAEAKVARLARSLEAHMTDKPERAAHEYHAVISDAQAFLVKRKYNETNCENILTWKAWRLRKHRKACTQIAKSRAALVWTARQAELEGQLKVAEKAQAEAKSNGFDTIGEADPQAANLKRLLGEAGYQVKQEMVADWMSRFIVVFMEAISAFGFMVAASIRPAPRAPAAPKTPRAPKVRPAPRKVKPSRDPEMAQALRRVLSDPGHNKTAHGWNRATQRDLADMTGTAPANVNRLLSLFSEQALIELRTTKSGTEWRWLGTEAVQ